MVGIKSLSLKSFKTWILHPSPRRKKKAYKYSLRWKSFKPITKKGETGHISVSVS